MRILLVEPYLTDSHRSWAEGYARHSTHKVELLTLPGRHWKWRMHGAAVQLSEACTSMEKPDIILASEMLDLATFNGLLPDDWKGLPAVLYFHENQLTYPWSDRDGDRTSGRDLHYAWIHLTGALVATEIWFNSRFHQDDFLKSLEGYLRRLPKPSILHRLVEVTNKSRVLPLGILPPDQGAGRLRDPRLILWNHRWEYDKNPDGFFQVLQQVKAGGEPFRLAILGKSFAQSPPIFEQAKDLFSEEIVHMGYVESRESYWKWLDQASLAPVTSEHDFFGLSVLEAASRGVVPLLPDRLSYPELFVDFPELIYQEEVGLTEKINQFLSGEYERRDELRAMASGFRWDKVARRYDEQLKAILARHP